MRLPVCKTSDVRDGETRAFDVPGLAEPVLVSNLGGRFVASASMCPHGDVSLVGARRVGTRIICPGHGYQFDLHSGRCAHDPRLTLPRFQVRIVGETVQIDLLAPQE